MSEHTDPIAQRLGATLRAVAEQTNPEPAPAHLRPQLAERRRSRPPLTRSRFSTRTALAVAAMTIAAVGAIVVTNAILDGGPSGDQVIETDPAPAARPDGQAAATLRVMPATPPSGFALDYATALPPLVEDSDCIGCVDLYVVPTDQPPIGYSDVIAVSVEPPGFTNTPDAERLTVRGVEAKLGTVGPSSKLSWLETSDTSVVVTYWGFDRDDVVAVAEGLVIDGRDVRAGALPDGAMATEALLGGPSVMLQFSADDGQRLAIEVFDAGRSPTAQSVAQLAAEPNNDQLIERPSGVGIVDPTQPPHILHWWSSDGLVIRIDGTSSDLGVEQLADLAATFEVVDGATWTARGGM